MTEDERDAQDRRLSAWLDGELDKDGADDMTRLITADDALAHRAERFGHVDALVRAAVPEEPLPAGLLERLGLAGPAADGTVIDLAAARRERAAGGPPARPETARPWHGPMLWRIAAQVLVIGGIGLGAALWLAPHDRQAAPDAAYRTLSNAARPGASPAAPVNAVILFASGTDAATARRLAAGAGARLVGEPNGAGAWKASIAPGRRDAALAALRRDQRVTMAEAIDGAAP